MLIKFFQLRHVIFIAVVVVYDCFQAFDDKYSIYYITANEHLIRGNPSYFLAVWNMNI